MNTVTNSHFFKLLKSLFETVMLIVSKCCTGNGRLRKSAGIVLAMFLVCLALPQSTLAQGLPFQASNPFTDGTLSQFANPTEMLSPTTLILEGALDEAEYTVGPGDVFRISKGGTIATSSTVTVSAEGDLVIPDVGAIRVSGLTLARAKEVAVEALQVKFVNENVAVALLEPRYFYVHVTGAVPQPGRFLASGVFRAHDVLQKVYESGGRSTQLPSAERPTLDDAFRPSLRTIEIQRRDGTTASADLIMYYATGDGASNPYLRDGDIVRVETYRNEFETIRVSGDVPYPGYYPFRPGDTVGDLLKIAFGSADYTVSKSVRIVRREGAGSDAQLLSAEDIHSGGARSISLEMGDHVMVASEKRSTAGVYGWVEYPGTYPIVSGETTLKELVEDAGGLKGDANLSLAYVERRSPTFLKSTSGVSDLDFFGRTNFRLANSNQRVLIDVAGALGSQGEYVLEDGDAVIFPREETTVYVVGNVPQGGYMTYRQGWTAGDYINAAGGLATNSRDVYVFASITGNYYKGMGQPVRPGDTVFIDREPTADSPELQSLLVTERTSKRQLKLASIQTVITGISTIAAVITTVVAIRR